MPFNLKPTPFFVPGYVANRTRIAQLTQKSRPRSDQASTKKGSTLADYPYAVIYGWSFVTTSMVLAFLAFVEKTDATKLAEMVDIYNAYKSPEEWLPCSSYNHKSSPQRRLE